MNSINISNVVEGKKILQKSKVEPIKGRVKLSTKGIGKEVVLEMFPDAYLLSERGKVFYVNVGEELLTEESYSSYVESLVVEKQKSKQKSTTKGAAADVVKSTKDNSQTDSVESVKPVQQNKKKKASTTKGASFKLEMKVLADMLDKVNTARSVNSVISTLDDFRFKATNGTLEIMATNIDSTAIVSTYIGCDDFDVSVDAGIREISKFSDSTHKFEILKGQREMLKISGQDVNCKIPLDEPQEDCHDLCTDKQVAALTIDTRLRKILTESISFCSEDELRSAMCGVHIYAKKGKLVIESTDAQILIKKTIDYTGNPFDIIVPKKLLMSVLSSFSERFTLKVLGKKFILCTEGQLTYQCRLKDEKFPNVDAVLPTNYAKEGNSFKVATDRFKSALTQTAFFANKTTNQVVLNISDSEVRITAHDIDHNTSATKLINCSSQFKNDVRQLSVSAKFMAATLSPTDSVSTIQYISANKCLIIENDDKDEIRLVMPVMDVNG